MAARIGASLLGGLGSGNLGTLFLTLSANPSNLISGMNQAVGSVEKGGAKILASAAKIGVAIAAVLGVAAVKAAGDFESSFTGVRKTVDATEKEFAQLEATFRDMTKAMPSGINEINRVAEAAGALGIKTENIASFTKTMIQLGETSNLTSDQAAVALAHIATATQMPQENFDRLAATIVKLGLSSNASESEITEMATRIALAGHQVGLTQAQIVGFATAIASVGIDAEAGGTAISQAMIRMAKSISSGDEKLELFAKTAGQTIPEFTNLFKTNAAEAVLKFVTGLGKMKDTGEDVFGTLEQLGLDGIRMTSVIVGLSGAGELLNKSLGDANKAWQDNNALTEAANKRYQTLWSQIKITWNIFNDILITVGQQLLPALKALNEVLKESLLGFGGVNDAGNDWIKDIAPAFISVIGTIGDVIHRLHISLLGLKKAWLEVLSVGAAFGSLGNETFKNLQEQSKATSDELHKLVNAPDFSDKLVAKFEKLNAGVKKNTDEVIFSIDNMLSSVDERAKGSHNVDVSALFPELAGPKISGTEATKKIDDQFKALFGDQAEVGQKHFLGGLPGSDPTADHLMAMKADEANMSAHLAELKTFSQEELGLVDSTNKKKLELITAYNEQLRALQLAQAQIMLSAASSTFEGLATITEQFGARQSGVFKALFAASKAFAIAEATVKIAQGIASAASLGFPAGIVGIAQVVAATSGIISSIQAVQLEFGGGRAAGGPVMPGKTFLVGEKGPELFSPGAAGTITANSQLGGSKVNVVVNNFTDAQAEVRETTNGDERTVEVIIARTKNSIASDLRQGTGDVTRSLQSSFGLKRAGK